MSRYSNTYPDEFDSIEHDDQYLTFINEREREFVRDLESGAAIRNLNAMFDELDEALGVK